MSETTTRRASTRLCETCEVTPCVCPCKHCSEKPCSCTPEEKYTRLANKRGDKFVHVCKLLRNLGDSYAYSINPELAEDLLEKFDAKLEEVRISWMREISKAREKTEEPTVSVE